MSTTLHVIFDLVFENLYFVLVIFHNRGRKTRFHGSSQNSLYEKSIFGEFEVNFLNA